MEGNSTNPASSITEMLYDAALRGNVAALQGLVQRDAFLAHRSSTSTALHVACKLGHLQFAWELLRLNPSLSEELDPNDKSSPLHVASRNGHLEVVKCLVSISPGTCFARDMYGMNPVHVSAVKGHLHVLDELLRATPPAARELVGAVGGGIGETILHLCAKYNRLEEMKLVVGAVGDPELLNATNGDGNTVMHVAVANKQLEIVQFLLEDGRVLKNAPNSKGLTSMDIFKQSYKDANNDHQLKLVLQQFHVLGSEEIKRAKEQGKDCHLEWLENQRSTLMVVASLIAAMAFQVGLNPPGGVWQETTTAAADGTNEMGHIAGLPVMAQQKKDHYKAFLILNTVGFVASMSSILLLISRLPCKHFFMGVIMVTMWVAITAMTLTYGVALLALAPEEYLSLVRHIILFGYYVWLIVMVLLLFGHLAWWTVRLLKLLVRSVKKLYVAYQSGILLAWWTVSIGREDR